MDKSFIKGLATGLGLGLAAGIGAMVCISDLVKRIDESVSPGLQYVGDDDDDDLGDLRSIFDDGTYDEFEDDLDEETVDDDELEDPEETPAESL